MDDLLREFLTETGEHLDTVDRELVRFERHAGDRTILRNIFRLIHSIKGTCGFLGLPRLEALAHAAESLMSRLHEGLPVTRDTVTVILATVDRLKVILAEIERLDGEPNGTDDDLIDRLESVAAQATDPVAASEPAPPAVASDAPESRDVAARAPPTIRIRVDRIEHLMTMVSDLVQTRDRLLAIARRSEAGHVYEAPLRRLSDVTAALQDGVMRARMQPIGHAWAKLPRLLRDLAGELGRPIDLVMNGGETELDRHVLELIRDPLTHLVRNAADHGIESPHERRAAGKPATGTIRLDAVQEGGTIRIEIGDDGRGLDYRAIGRRAVTLGLVTEAERDRLPESRVVDFVFRSGFSTREVATAISGRGVGMDVVRANLDAVGGTIAIASERGRGTNVTLTVPLALAPILDPNGLARQIGPPPRQDGAPPDDSRVPTPGAVEVALLVFRSAGLKAVPLAMVRRLEEVDAAVIVDIEGTPHLRSRGRLLPVLALPGATPTRDGRLRLVIVAAGDRAVALAVDEIVDIVDGRAVRETVPARVGLAGPCVVAGRTIEIVDAGALLAARGTPARMGDAPARTVLLADGTPLFRDMLGPVLQASGYRVRFAASAEAALDRLAREPIAVLVTDLDMADRNGLPLIEALRRRPGGAALPVIALASGPSAAARDRARMADVIEIVAKFDRSGLVAALAGADPPTELAA